MKKLLMILAILLVPVSTYAGNIFSHIFKGRNYAPLCSTSPASSPVKITLREIRYESDSTYIEKQSDTRSEVTSKPAKIYIQYAVRNKSKKTVTACYFHIKVCYNSMGTLGGTLYEGNVTRMGCNIRPGKKLVDTIHERYSSSNNSHELIKSGFSNDVSKIICKVYFVKYSDGTSEGFNPDL
jgi:hypothetical protein